MDINKTNETNPMPSEQQTDTWSVEEAREPIGKGEENAENSTARMKEKPQTAVSAENSRTLSVGEWMITLLFFILPVINIIMMAVWAFSSKGNIHRKNFSRACLLWLIILLLGYVVAMTVAGYTIFDIFTPRI